MDFELARPEPVSVDTGITVVALIFVGYGAFRLFREVGTPAGVEGWLFVVAGWLLVFPRLFLGLALTDDAVEVSVVSGRRRISFDEVTGARVVDGHLSLPFLGVLSSGYQSGNFRLTGEDRVKAYVSRFSGPFVLVERGAKRPVVVSPAEIGRFVEQVRERANLA